MIDSENWKQVLVLQFGVKIQNISFPNFKKKNYKKNKIKGFHYFQENWDLESTKIILNFRSTS